jgi:hypothetical protein
MHFLASPHWTIALDVAHQKLFEVTLPPHAKSINPNFLWGKIAWGWAAIALGGPRDVARWSMVDNRSAPTPSRRRAAAARCDRAAPEQESRFEPDVWETPIKHFLEGRDRTTVMEIALGALDYEPARPGMAVHPGEPQPVRGTPINRLAPRDQQRITAILEHLKWTPKRTNKDRFWQRPVSPDRSQVIEKPQRG